MFLDRSVHFIDLMVRISRVGEVHAHQHNNLTVDCNLCCNDTFADVFCPLFSVFKDTGDDAPSERNLTCASASVTTKGR